MTVETVQHFTFTDEGKKRLQCYVCGKRFVIERILQQHISSVHKESKSWQCNLCNKSFLTEKSLKMHHTQVHDENWKCCPSNQFIVGSEFNCY